MKPGSGFAGARTRGSTIQFVYHHLNQRLLNVLRVVESKLGDALFVTSLIGSASKVENEILPSAA